MLTLCFPIGFRQEHVPYCFNALEPYYNTVTAVHVIEKTGDDGKVGNHNLTTNILAQARAQINRNVFKTTEKTF